MPGGPQPIERGQRFETALAIADRIHQHYGERVLAIGLYGSVARGADGPYSDIEMHCVLHGADFEVSHEWSAGPWKAEVDVYSQDVMLARARTLDLDWPLTHRSYVEVMPLYDPTGFFERLRVAVLDHPDQAFRQLIGMTIVGEVYEVVGKVRNARAAGNDTYLPAPVKAGIKVAMVTGDHALTAKAIGEQIGLAEGARVLTGRDLEAMTDDELRDLERRAFREFAAGAGLDLGSDAEDLEPWTSERPDLDAGPS
jgi:kanamycin nucleotidyltransferase